MLVSEIPGKLQVTWCPTERAMWDKWTNQNVTLEEFKQTLPTRLDVAENIVGQCS